MLIEAQDLGYGNFMSWLKEAWILTTLIKYPVFSVEDAIRTAMGSLNEEVLLKGMSREEAIELLKKRLALVNFAVSVEL